MAESKGGGRKGTMGKAALLIGAAGLLLFIVGVKRRYRLDEEREIDLTRDPENAAEEPDEHDEAAE